MAFGYRLTFLAALAAVSLALSAPATAAGSTAVVLEPSGQSTSAGETATVDVVVDRADGGVGSYDVEVSIADRSVANVTRAQARGSPELNETRISNPGRVRVRASGANTTDEGSVTVATVWLTGRTDGRTDVSLTVTAVGDEDGNSYSVSRVRSASLLVDSGSASGSDDGSSDDDGDEETAGSTATPTETDAATATATPTPTATATATATATPTATATEAEGGAEPEPTTPDAGGGFPWSAVLVGALALLGTVALGGLYHYRT